jgi:hypothetical protein
MRKAVLHREFFKIQHRFLRFAKQSQKKKRQWQKHFHNTLVFTKLKKNLPHPRFCFGCGRSRPGSGRPVRKVTSGHLAAVQKWGLVLYPRIT